MIDIHSHILPGIDDGASNFEVSINLVRELCAQGVTDIIATPHYVDETIYTSGASENTLLLDELQERIIKEGLNVKLYLGNEIYINGYIDELIKNGEISTLAGSKYILVELPMDGEYPNYEDILIDLMDCGYKVILAHPERYVSFQKDFELVEQLYNMGVLLQCNINSINGAYGKRAKKTIKKLAKNKMIFAFGTDIHHCHETEIVTGAKKKLSKYYGEAELEKLLSENARQIID